MPFNREKYHALLETLTERGWLTFGPRVMVLRDDAPKETTGGLVIPDEAQKREKGGTVVSLGQGYMEAGEKEYTKGVTVGFYVLFNSYDGVEMVFKTRLGEIPVVLLHVGNLYAGRPNKEV